jgi:hypothetical protein
MFGYFVYGATRDPYIETANAAKYMYGIGMPIMLLMGYYFYQFIQANYPDNLTGVSMALFMIAMVFLISMWYVGASMWSLSMISFLGNAVFLLILIVALALGFFMYGNSLKSTTGWKGVFINLIFYLPCLVLDLVQYIKREFQLTGQPIYILLGVEAMLILFYLYIPKLVLYLSRLDTVPILEGSAYLDIPRTLAVNDDTMMPNTLAISDTADPVVRNHYAISMWLYVNHYTSNTIAYNKETLIFDYGEGRPKITFANTDVNNIEKRDTYRFYFTNVGEDRFYEFKMPGQRWNQLVFNYTSNYVDLFVNGHLERTFYLKNKQPNYATDNIVKIGATDGIIGAISNITYHKSPMTKSAIAAKYNLLKNKSPPTIKM